MSGAALSDLSARVITPDAARELLEFTRKTGCRPDPVDMDYARRLAHDMACGDWDEANVVPLALCSHGAVIRGLHRLQAVVISRVPRTFFIARDVPHRVRYIPRGKARTAADALGVIGVATHRKMIAGAVHLVHLYESERDAVPWTAWDTRVFTNVETVRLLQTRYPDLPRSVPTMIALRSGLRSTPIASLTSAYLITHAVPELGPAVSEFLQGLISPSHLGLGDPRRDLHECLMTRDVTTGRRAVSAHQLGLIISCWNAWAIGAPWDDSEFGPDDSMPAICRTIAVP
ncbi:hypothetical protein [Streptomyces graminilatus]|uniref:hypothetical protein n=1 Tax=Streptomyces graminilatus TaxID=1464070 RepID=UPI000ABA374D|nr:hypothetical protein [Streptomyces graminilatus]